MDGGTYMKQERDFGDMTFKIIQVTGILTVLSMVLIILPSSVNALPNITSTTDYANFMHNNAPRVVRLSPTEDISRRDIGPHGNQCDYGSTDDLLWTLIDGANNTITLWCKRVPIHTSHGDMMPWPGDVTTRQFIGYYNDVYVIGFCPFDRGQNSWHWTFGKNNVFVSSNWISTALNGTSVTFGFTWNTTAPIL